MLKIELEKQEWERVIKLLLSEKTLHAVKERLLKDIDINAIEKNSGDTLLIEACRQQNVDAVRYLISKGANVNKANNNGYTPLFYAAHDYSFEIVKCLIDAGANPNCLAEAEKDGNYAPLYSAANIVSPQHYQSAKYMLEKGADPDLKGKLLQIPPLYCAAQSNNLKVVNLLFQFKANPNVVTAANETALHAAVEALNEEIVEVLLAKGVDASIQDSQGRTALYKLIVLAKKENYFRIQSIIRLFHQYKVNLDQVSADQTAVTLAIDGGHLSLLKTLIGVCKANPNVQVQTKVALARNKAELSSLQQSGATITYQVTNYSPLALAIVKGFFEGVTYLINQKADVNAVFGDSQFTPLHLASSLGYEKVCQQLLDAGAEINAIAKMGCTAVYLAAQNNRIAVLKCLLHRDDIKGDQPNDEQTTPLHLASKKGHIEAVRLLLLYGAAVNAISNDGATPVFAAAQEGHTAVVQLLLERGADPEILRKDGNSPLFIAYREKHKECIKVLVQYFYKDFLSKNDKLVDFEILSDTLVGNLRGISLVPKIIDVTPVSRLPQGFFAKKRAPNLAATTTISASTTLPLATPLASDVTRSYSQSARKFLMERGFSEQDIQLLQQPFVEPAAIQTKSTVVPIDPRDITWCSKSIHAGMEGIMRIEASDLNQPAYLYLDRSNLDQSDCDLSVFDNLLLKMCGSKGEQGIKQLISPPKGTVRINHEEKEVEFTHELKIKSSKVRILCFNLPSDSNNGILLIGAVVVDKGLHKAKSEKFLAINKVIDIQLPLQNRQKMKIP